MCMNTERSQFDYTTGTLNSKWPSVKQVRDDTHLISRCYARIFKVVERKISRKFLFSMFLLIPFWCFWYWTRLTMFDKRVKYAQKTHIGNTKRSIERCFSINILKRNKQSEPDFFKNNLINLIGNSRNVSQCIIYRKIQFLIIGDCFRIKIE